MSAPAAAPAQSAEAARVRVGVLVATYQVDVVIPTKFTVETFIDDLLVVLAEAIDDDDVDFTAPTGLWSLARPGEPPIPRWHVLADYDIADGALLMLSVVESGEEFRPVVEDITDALALTNEREFAEYDAETSMITGTVVLCLGATAAAVLLSWSWMETGSFWWCGLPTLILGVAAALGAVRFARGGTRPRIGLGVALSAVPLLFAGGAMLIPPPYGEPGPFGAANLAAGAVLAAVSTIVLLRLTGWAVAAMIATTTMALSGAAAALTATYTNLGIRQIGGATLLVGLVLLTFAARLAVMLARIQPPDLPDPGTDVNPASLTDIFDAESGAADGRISADPSHEPRGRAASADIESRARYAVACLRGLIVAIATLLAVAAVTVSAVSPGGIREIVVAAAVAVILVMRARWHPDRVQALALIGAAATVVLGVGGVLVGAYASPWARLLVVVIVVSIAGAGCAAAVHLPKRRLTPVTRRMIDLLEYALIVLVPVLACWIAGIYTALRRI